MEEKLKKSKTIDEIIMEKANKNDVIALQTFYVQGQLENLDDYVKTYKQETIARIEEYLLKNTKVDKDIDGNVTNKEVKHTPYLLTNYFFKTINNLHNIEPKYSAEELSVLWNLYQYLVEEVNLKIADFTPRISHFCSFIGITTEGFKKMKNGSNQEIKNVVFKIYDACYDYQIYSSQSGKLKEKTTIFRMKTEQEITEKVEAPIIFQAKEINFDAISNKIKQINELNDYNNKKIIEANDFDGD